MICILVISDQRALHATLHRVLGAHPDIRLIGSVGSFGEAVPLLQQADVAVATFSAPTRRKPRHRGAPLPLHTPTQSSLQSVIAAVRIVAGGGLLILSTDSRTQAVIFALKQSPPFALRAWGLRHSSGSASRRTAAN